MVGLQYGLGKAKIFFSGDLDFRKTSADFPPAGGVWGGIHTGFGFLFLRNPNTYNATTAKM